MEPTERTFIGGMEIGSNKKGRGSETKTLVVVATECIGKQIEREMISQRTKEALAKKRAEGVILGRPKGSKSKKNKLSGNEKKIIEMLKKGVSQNKIACHLGIHRHTINSFVKNNRHIIFSTRT